MTLLKINNNIKHLEMLPDRQNSKKDKNSFKSRILKMKNIIMLKK